MIVIVGASSSGKTVLAKEFVKQNTEYKRIITYTTRPKRENEVDGIDYYFITNERFIELMKQGFFAETNVYREWYYGTALDDCTDDDKSIAVLTPAGLRNIVKRHVHVISVYLYVDRAHRLMKSIQRGDNIDEAYRRNLSDEGQFDGVENEVMAVIDNKDMRLSVNDVLSVFNDIISANRTGEVDG